MTTKEPLAAAGYVPPAATSPAGAAAYLGLCERTVINMLKRGQIPSTKLGKRRLIPIAALEAIVSGATYEKAA
jgi:excisionase family DNA binding protein